MIQTSLCSTAVSGVDLGNPLVIMLAFIIFDLIPTLIHDLILAVADIDPFMQYTEDTTRHVFILHPIYSVFLPLLRAHGYTMLEVGAWLVCFFPVFEEVLFFAVPAMYGSFTMALICGLFWAGIHIVRFTAWCLRMGYSKKQVVAGTLASIIMYVPIAFMSALFWVAGQGMPMILLHSFHNMLFVASYYRATHSTPKLSKIGRYYRLGGRRYYKFKTYPVYGGAGKEGLGTTERRKYYRFKSLT